MSRSSFGVALVAAAACASSAMADDLILTFSYDDLGGSYVADANPAPGTARSGQFTALAVNTAFLQSSGDVSRVVPTEGTASFEPGFVSAANPADAVFNLSVAIANAGDTTGAGAGSFTLTDADGDTITGSISGTWTIEDTGLGGQFVAFNGLLSNVVLNGSTFNGTDLFNSDNFDMDLPGSGPYNGAIVLLSFDISTFFTADFTEAPSA